jgi:hypothetical protein
VRPAGTWAGRVKKPVSRMSALVRTLVKWFFVDLQTCLTEIVQVCAMSGEPPVEPVVSRKTGHMFEKRTILTYILETGNCPITGQPLSSEDLLELKG